MKFADGSDRNIRDDDHPWNKPSFDISLQARYNMGDKILVNAGIYTIGKRYYEDFDSATEEQLPLTVDANLGIEYRYSKLLSFWLQINNLAAQRYYLYHQYPSYRFRAMLGFSYTL
jgi:outer membrane receptor for monomeric catechols